jgi:hypothetical protein
VASEIYNPNGGLRQLVTVGSWRGQCTSEGPEFADSDRRLAARSLQIAYLTGAHRLQGPVRISSHGR